ncbi:MAG: protease inhibitor I42 family protein [Bacilli bacterium]|nr:protease inhibitor I42 family protein [Bacilli bacterium]
MNKRIIIGVMLLIILVLIIIICIFRNNSYKKNSDKELELTYKTNGGVPFKWEYEIEDKDIVEFVRSYVVEDKNNSKMVGAPIKKKYVFKGLKEGNTTIIFRYVSITDGKVAEEDRNNVKVDKDKNISLILGK